MLNQFLASWRHGLRWSGRAGRREFWGMLLGNSLICTALVILNALLPEAGLRFVASAFVLIALIPTASAASRRLRDCGRSVWWLLISLIPVFGPVIVLSLAVLPSTPEPDQGNADSPGSPGWNLSSGHPRREE